MEKIRVAVVGYGNIGKYAIEAVRASVDMELCGVVVRRIPEKTPTELIDVPITKQIEDLGKVDVALLCIPTREILENAKKYLAMGIHTVDTYDIHNSIFELKTELDEIAKNHNAVAIVSAGWDPGSDSMIRAIMESCAPKGLTYTNFGPGMSMGHSVAAKAIDGVAAAMSMTIPLGTSIHRRVVYVQLEKNASFEKVADAIKKDEYFSHDETHVIQVDDVERLMDRGHAVNMVRKGVSGVTQNQIFEFSMTINNPAVTAQVMVSSARAVVKQKPGAYTLIEIPIIDLLYGEKESIIRRLY